MLVSSIPESYPAKCFAPWREEDIYLGCLPCSFRSEPVDFSILRWRPQSKAERFADSETGTCFTLPHEAVRDLPAAFASLTSFKMTRRALTIATIQASKYDGRRRRYRRYLCETTLLTACQS
jgi:hypothetical protein